MGLTLASSNSPKPARMSKLRSLVTVVLLSTTIPLTIAAATAAQIGNENHHGYVNLTSEHWQDMQYDQYLRTYPNGNVMTLPQYVEHLSLPERFECGVGRVKSCLISPLGQTLDGPDWYILHATSVWNFYANSLVHAFRRSVSLTKTVVRHILKDLVHEYNPRTCIGLLTEVDLLKMLLFPIDHGGNRDPRVSKQTHEEDWMAAIKPIAGNSPSQLSAGLKKSPEVARYARVKRQLSDKPTALEVPLIVYNSTEPVETNLDGLSLQLHSMLVQSIDNKINSPISLETGIYSALEYGRFASPKFDPARLASNAHNITSLLAVSALLNHQNAMVVVRKSRCSEYRNDIKNSKTRLAICTSDNTLIEIVLVNGEDTFSREIYNAHLIQDKYGFKTSFLVSEALRCQEKIRGVDAQDEGDNDDDNQYEVCTFQLPICDLKQKHYQNLLNQDENLVHICRDVVGLPI